MKRLFSTLAAVSALSAFGLFLLTVLDGISKTLTKSTALTTEESALIEKLGDPKWTDYFFSFITAFILLLLGIFLIVVYVKDRATFAPAASHILSLGSIVMVMMCMKTVLDGKIALMYDSKQMFAALALTLITYAFLMVYSSITLTTKEFKRYL